jgi:hypothetical protein
MVSKYLAEMAQMLDYACHRMRPAREAAGPISGVAGARGVTDMPDDAVKAYANDAASAIVALTHDPRIDDMGLMEALKTPAFYVGAMGSVKTSAGRRKAPPVARRHRCRTRAAARTDRAADRQQDPAGNRDRDPGRDHGR